jgi:hypothetical protein
MGIKQERLDEFMLLYEEKLRAQLLNRDRLDDTATEKRVKSRTEAVRRMLSSASIDPYSGIFRSVCNDLRIIPSRSSLDAYLTGEDDYSYKVK